MGDAGQRRCTALLRNRGRRAQPGGRRHAPQRPGRLRTRAKRGVRRLRRGRRGETDGASGRRVRNGRPRGGSPDQRDAGRPQGAGAPHRPGRRHRNRPDGQRDRRGTEPVPVLRARIGVRGPAGQPRPAPYRRDLGRDGRSNPGRSRSRRTARRHSGRGRAEGSLRDTAAPAGARAGRGGGSRRHGRDDQRSRHGRRLRRPGLRRGPHRGHRAGRKTECARRLLTQGQTVPRTRQRERGRNDRPPRLRRLPSRAPARGRPADARHRLPLHQLPATRQDQDHPGR